MKKILVPTDFSPLAENALKVAAKIAKKHDGEIFLLHLLDLPVDLIDPTSAGDGNVLPESLFFMKLAHQRFTSAMKKDYLKGIKVHETVEFNEAFDGIMKVSQKHDCDLIVMGSHGSEGLKEVFVGSNTEKVVRYSDIPVLVIKNEAENFKAKSFLFATNLALETTSSYLTAVKFAEKMGVKMKSVFINTVGKFRTSDHIEGQIEKFREAVNDKNLEIIVRNDKNMEDGILNYAKKIDADLVGIGTHGRKGISRLLNGSLSEHVVNHAKRPVITFKIK